MNESEFFQERLKYGKARLKDVCFKKRLRVKEVQLMNKITCEDKIEQFFENNKDKIQELKDSYVMEDIVREIIDGHISEYDHKTKLFNIDRQWRRWRRQGLVSRCKGESLYWRIMFLINKQKVN